MKQISSRYQLQWLVAFLLSGFITSGIQAQEPKALAASPNPIVSSAPVPTTPASQAAEALEAPNTVVLKVGDQQFTKADIDFLIQNLPPQAQRAIAAQGKKSLGDQYALIVMLSQQAHLQHLDQSPDFVQKLAFQKRQLEAQAAIEAINQQVKVTPEEIQQFYTAHTADYDEIKVRQIVIRKKAPNPQAGLGHPPTLAGQGLSPEDAKTRADAIRKELTAGTDIKKVIEDFKSPGDVIIEADPRTIRKGAMRPEMERVAFALKDNEVSEPVDIPQALILFQVTGHSQLDLKDVTPDIEKALRQQKVDAALAEVKKNSTVWMDEQYFSGPPRPQGQPTMGTPVVKPPTQP